MARTKTKNELREIDDIREDLDSLKSNVVALTHHLTDMGADRVEDFRGEAETRAKKLRKSALKNYAKVEAGVKEKPAKAMMMAFGAGLLASYMLKGRR